MTTERGETPPGAGTPEIEIEGLWRELGERNVLRGIDLVLARGETLAVLGPNGAGKTTLLRIIATLLRPSAGRVSVLGCELPREAWRLRGRLGYLGHEPLLYRELTGRENLRFHARLFGLPGDGADVAEALLEGVGLAHRGDTRVGEMSAGMVQRLAVCRCVLHGPELLLLDEPRAHLDPEAAESVEPLIGAATGLTRVLVTHDVAAGLAEGGQVLALARDGSVAYRGPATGLSPEEAREIYAGGPGPGAPRPPGLVGAHAGAPA